MTNTPAADYRIISKGRGTLHVDGLNCDRALAAALAVQA